MTFDRWMDLCDSFPNAICLFLLLLLLREMGAGNEN